MGIPIFFFLIFLEFVTFKRQIAKPRNSQFVLTENVYVFNRGYASNF